VAALVVSKIQNCHHLFQFPAGHCLRNRNDSFNRMETGHHIGLVVRIWRRPCRHQHNWVILFVFSPDYNELLWQITLDQLTIVGRQLGVLLVVIGKIIQEACPKQICLVFLCASIVRTSTQQPAVGRQLLTFR